MNQRVYIITETDNLEDTTDIVSVHGTPARALIEMRRIAEADGSYRQMVGDDAEWPFWESPERTLELDVRDVH